MLLSSLPRNLVRARFPVTPNSLLARNFAQKSENVKPETSSEVQVRQGDKSTPSLRRNRSIFDEMNRFERNLFRDPFKASLSLMDDVLNPRRWGLSLPEFTGGLSPNLDWSPSADLTETNDAFEIQADLPGVSKENVKVELQENVLSISGEKTQEKKEDDKLYHKVERFYGTFQRRFSLPDNIDKNGIDASFKDGVLKLRIPKKVKESTTIKINPE